ncbi:MAG: hypothetical protein ACK4WH_13080 [Phycisphaerales bacterium]
MTTEPDPLTLQDGDLDRERDMFCCGEPIWPKGKYPFRAEFSLSCGWVIVDPDGRESTLGYANEKQARDVAEKMTYAYWQGAYRHGASRSRRDDDLADDRCKQCGKRCPNATCPACQEANARAVNVEPAPGVEAFTSDGRFISGTGYGGERR